MFVNRKAHQCMMDYSTCTHARLFHFHTVVVSMTAALFSCEYLTDSTVEESSIMIVHEHNNKYPQLKKTTVPHTNPIK